MTPEAIRQLTQPELEALKRRQTLREYREDMRVAMLCALIANRHRSKRERRYRMQDFLLSPIPAWLEAEQKNARNLALMERLRASQRQLAAGKAGS